MKRLLILTISLLLIASFCFADSLSSREKKELRDAGYTRSDIRKIENGRRSIEPTYKYESTTGNRYKYDLSKPLDRLEYEMDLGTQLEDNMKMPINPSVEMDRNFGQHGGGIMD